MDLPVRSLSRQVPGYLVHDGVAPRIEPLKKITRMCRRHREFILNWFKAKGQISSGIVEGPNNKAKLTIRTSYGFRSPEILEMALYHALRKPPEPKLTHEFY